MHLLNYGIHTKLSLFHYLIKGYVIIRNSHSQKISQILSLTASLPLLHIFPPFFFPFILPMVYLLKLNFCHKIVCVPKTGRWQIIFLPFQARVSLAFLMHAVGLIETCCHYLMVYFNPNKPTLSIVKFELLIKTQTLFI